MKTNNKTAVLFYPATINGRYLKRYPILVNNREGVVLSAAAYLFHRADNNASEKTLEGDAYTLSEYIDFLCECGVNHSSITTEVLKRFLDLGAKRGSNVIYMRSRDIPLVYKDTIRRKRGVIYAFYHVLQDSLGILSHVLSPSASGNEGLFRLPAKPVRTGIGVPRAADDDRKTRQMARDAKERKRRPKATPSPSEVKAVLEKLLSKSADGASIYYLAASLEAYGGARSCGVEDLTVAAFADALLEEPTVLRFLEAHTVPHERDWLATCAGTPLGAAVARGLKALERDGRRFIFVMVLEKGRARPLSIPIELGLDILDYIWTERRRFIVKRQSRNPGYAPPDSLFLSTKTGMALRAGSIGKVVSKALRDCGVPGTSHRLRATFAEEIVRDLYHKDRHANAGKADFISIIELAREMLGHTSDTAIRRYLNNITKKDRLLGGHVVLVKESDDKTILEKLASKLDASDDAALREALELLIGSDSA